VPKALGDLLSKVKLPGIPFGGLLIVSWSTYVLSVAYATDSIRLRKLVVSAGDDPVLFWFGVVLHILFLAFGLVLLLQPIHRKVGQYGGNYNLATFKAIIRGR